MTDKQPKALRLADALTTPSSFQCSRWGVADELRRLHEVNTELVEALTALADEAFINMTGGRGDLIDTAFAVIAKAKENK